MKQQKQQSGCLVRAVRQDLAILMPGLAPPTCKRSTMFCRGTFAAPRAQCKPQMVLATVMPRSHLFTFTQLDITLDGWHFSEVVHFVWNHGKQCSAIILVLFAEQVATINLPSSVFASEFEEDVGLLNKAAPISGSLWTSLGHFWWPEGTTTLMDLICVVPDVVWCKCNL